MKLSFNDDSEELMISKLKLANGVSYTSSFEIMFKDMNISKEVNDEYDMYKNEKKSFHEIDFKTQVLTSTSWPYKSEQNTNFKLPMELANLVTDFSTFYNKKRYKGRTLSWKYSDLSHGELHANCFKYTKLLSVSTYEMAILLLFNDQNEISIKEIHDATSIPEIDITNIISNMLKMRLVLCTNNEANIETKLNLDNTVMLNLKFSTKKIKVRLNFPLKAKVETVKKETYELCVNTRKNLTQSAIVRILKTRKTYDYMKLVKEVQTILSSRFIVSEKFIKVYISILC